MSDLTVLALAVRPDSIISSSHERKELRTNTLGQVSTSIIGADQRCQSWLQQSVLIRLRLQR
jgi:hypothetical protein